jgi:hypothetical protein
MRKLLICAFTLWVLLTGGIVVTTYIGNNQSLPSAIKQLHLADCALPCWARIVPGQTAFEESARYIEMLPGTSELNLSEMAQSRFNFFKFPVSFEDNTTKTIEGYLGLENGRVYWINIPSREMAGISTNPSVIRPFMPYLADILFTFGPPSCIGLDRTSNGKTILVYMRTNGVVIVSIFASDSEHFQLTRPIYSIDFITIESHQNTCDRSVDPNVRPWHGLMSFDSYQAMP